ncbi:uncharacterized protein BP5553_05432 [Venustampulla echinocandica]|uniref:Uncharacterized protein n=1 Tax=Venustampulla echinocandica TaxID=2656787 RepID=A0A370TR55_9HELO|nr:uncharacterized protein BP5553_05432 [Venustampulla echinocandica]RDL37999.1 hypothetical protein BP5553_05432 [Venustampulla echinocandica]
MAVSALPAPSAPEEVHGIDGIFIPSSLLHWNRTHVTNEAFTAPQKRDSGSTAPGQDNNCRFVGIANTTSGLQAKFENATGGACEMQMLGKRSSGGFNLGPLLTADPLGIFVQVVVNLVEQMINNLH